jgi:hypothetical protein
MMVGPASGYVDTSQVYEEGFRAADDALAVYELFVGDGQAPDFNASGQPVATSLTLPFQWTPSLPSSGDAEYHLVVRKRNKYDLQSFNVWERIITFDAGVEQPSTVSAPLNLVAYDGASGYLRIVAKYFSADDVEPADTWEIYVKIGSAPVIGVDAAVFSGLMMPIGVESGLAQTVGPYTPGTTAYIIVAAKRTSDSERGTASIQKVLIEDINLTDGQMFGGSAYEQR